MKYKIAFVGNSSLTMHNFRINLLRSMVKLGYEVVVLAPKDSDTTSYKSNRIRYIPIDVDCKGVNPVKDFALMNQLRALYVKEKFDFVFHYTIKPVIYGSIAARLARVKHISVITGLGYTFLNSGFLNKLVIECDTFDQARRISWAARDRGEMKYINICSKYPYYNSAKYYVSNKKFSDLGGTWLTYFTNN